MKKPLESALSVHGNSENAIAGVFPHEGAMPRRHIAAFKRQKTERMRS